MDDGGHRENGRHKADQFKAAQNQWLMQHQPSMKHIVAIMAERDAALQERNLALADKKAAQAERDMAILQRDAAIQERNAAIMERDNAIATLQYRESAMNGDVPTPPISRGLKHLHHSQNEVPYGSRDIHIPDALSICPSISEPLKPRKVKRSKEVKTASFKKGPRSRKQEEMGGDDLSKQLALSRPEWKGQDLGLNQVAFDDSTMPPPVCSCTGMLRQCYKWGSGGWQSSCCTTTISVYPLPAVPNKRHARIGGRKMSGSAFNKLLSRLASEGYDLSNPVDLKDHWARHGTNRYITIK